jgi:putative GTP pyrophosphokinase
MPKPDLHREYELLRPDATRLCDALKRELEKMFARKSLTLGIPLQARVKDWDSIAEKFDRKDLSLSTLKNLDDFIGIRSVFLFRRDLISARELVENTFEVLSEEDTATRLDESEFGYQSWHFIVKLPASWLKVPSFEGLGVFRSEIQLRTLSQHIWASASHQLQYKREDSVPKPIRRTIHRASALLETVDLEFERVLQEREQYLVAVNTLVNDRLNVDSLARVLDEMLPAANKVESEIYAELLPDLTAFGVATTSALRALIKKRLQKAVAYDKDRVVHFRNDRTLTGRAKERVKRGIFYTHVGLVRRMLHDEYGTRYLKYIKARSAQRAQLVAPAKKTKLPNKTVRRATATRLTPGKRQ